jgi:CheY-like chemotaxis protein
MTASKTPKKRILIVEDQPEIRELLVLLLEQAGFEVQPAEHALAAVFAIVHQKPDLILTDIRMPIIDGIALINEIRTHSDSADIPVMIVTGLDSPECRDAAIKAGCAGYITKPIDPLRFGAQIRAFFSPRESAPKSSVPRKTGHGHPDRG